MYCASMYFYSLCNISPAGQVGSGEDLDLVVLEHVADLKIKEFIYSTTVLIFRWFKKEYILIIKLSEKIASQNV